MMYCDRSEEHKNKQERQAEKRSESEEQFNSDADDVRAKTDAARRPSTMM
jgi:hypothetical protein